MDPEAMVDGADDRWEDEWPERHQAGMGWRVSLSILAGVGWLAFLLVWLVFYASGYSGYQNIAVVLLSLLVMAGLLGIPWTIWGWRHRSPAEADMMETKGLRWRVVFSAVSVPAALLLLVGWLYFYADGYSIYRNIAVVLIALLITGGLQGAVWAPWGMRHGR